jgi:hypothetical protein
VPVLERGVECDSDEEGDDEFARSRDMDLSCLAASTSGRGTVMSFGSTCGRGLRNSRPQSFVTSHQNENIELIAAKKSLKKVNASVRHTSSSSDEYTGGRTYQNEKIRCSMFQAMSCATFSSAISYATIRWAADK